MDPTELPTLWRLALFGNIRFLRSVVTQHGDQVLEFARQVQQADDHDMLPVFCGASQVGDLDMLDFLWTTRPDLIEEVDQRGMTCLMHACDVKTVVWLLEKAHPDLAARSKPDTGHTALHVFVRRSRADLVVCLVDARPDVLSLKCRDGLTPAGLAYRQQNVALAELLDHKAAVFKGL